MSIKNRVLAELKQLRQANPSGGSPGTLALDVDGGRLTCQLTAIDQLACAFELFTVHVPSLEQADLAALDRIATKLSARLNYLLESISPVEKDKDGCVVQMRSNPPQRDDDGTSYYELVVRRGELSLCRYSKAGGQARRVIPAQVTQEVFCRLVDDFSAVAAKA